MSKEKNNGKDLYRKKAFSGKIERDLEKEYLDFIKEFKKLPQKPPRLILDFLTEKFGPPGGEEKNPDLKIIVFFVRMKSLGKCSLTLGIEGQI